MVNNKYPTDTCIDVFLPFSSFFASTTDIQIVSRAYYTAIEEADPSRELKDLMMRQEMQ